MLVVVFFTWVLVDVFVLVGEVLDSVWVLVVVVEAVMLTVMDLVVVEVPEAVEILLELAEAVAVVVVVLDTKSTTGNGNPTRSKLKQPAGTLPL